MDVGEPQREIEVTPLVEPVPVPERVPDSVPEPDREEVGV